MIPVVIPAKPLDTALQRLSRVLDPAERRTLQAAMLSDVVSAACAYSDQVVVVTADDIVVQLARSRGARVAPEPHPGHGINPAVRIGLAALNSDRALIVMGDVPCATEADLRHVAQLAPIGPGVSLAVSRDGRGTNAMLLEPADVIRPLFGEDSLARHLQAAEDAQCDATVVTAPGLMLDVDTPDDLALLVTAHAGIHTREVCAALALETRLSAYVA